MFRLAARANTLNMASSLPALYWQESNNMGHFSSPQLDDVTRKFMLSELESDIRSGTLYQSKDFSDQGRSNYPAAIRAAIESGDEDSLKSSLTADCFNETRSDKNGRVTRLNREDSARKLADGEFLRFYLRGICLRAAADDVPKLQVYRAKQSANPRQESEEMIGTEVDATALLLDLRQTKGLDTHLGLPPGPHSGLAARY